MELVVMCPAVCVGPTLNQNLSESLASVTRPLSGGLPLVPGRCSSCAGPWHA